MKKLIKKFTASFIVAAVVLSALTMNTSAYIHLALNKTELSLKVSQSFKLEVTVNTDVESVTLIWKSSDESVVKVGKDGIVTAVAPGTAEVSVSAVEDPDINDNPDIIPVDITLGETEDDGQNVCVVTVEKAGVDGISLDRETLNIRYKSSATLTAALTPESADSKEVKWSSSNADIASVDGSGKVTGTGRGTALITAETLDGGHKAVCKVKVSYSVWQWLIVIFLGGWLWY